MLNKKIKQIKWWQLSQRQRMSPFPNYMSMESVTREMRGVIGYAYEQVVMILEEGNFWLFMDKAEHERVGKGVLKKVFKEPAMFVRLAKEQRRFAKSFYTFLKKNNKPSALKKISNKKLSALHEEYEKRYKQVYSHYFPILSVENYFFGYLGDYIKQREPSPAAAAHKIGSLITEPRAMWNRLETADALELSLKISKNKKWLACFKKRALSEAVERVKQDSKLNKLINQHAKKWFWITRDYDDPILEFEDFVERAQNHLKGNPKQKLEKMQKEDKQYKQDISDIIKKLKIDKKHARLFQTMREGIYYKELRKSIVSQTLYYYDPILKEIARRAGLTLRQARHLKTSEVRPLLAKRIDMCHELNGRIKLSVFHAIRGQTIIYIGKQAKEYYDYFVKVDKKVRELYGAGVSAGVARGRAKIVINPDAFHKVKKGDIIITLQATPIFTRVLSISAGLVCDGGPGITSHPATLAREAGIPGIIGARMATKILKDGDMVEVDGNQGVMRRL